MKNISILLALLIAQNSIAADQVLFSGPGTGPVFVDNAGKQWPATLVYTSDGAGNFVPIGSGSVTIGTAQQGARAGSAQPWYQDIEQILGAAPSATNGLASRITNGTSYVDPTQIRALTSADTVTCAQATAGNLNATVVGSVTANAGTNLNTSLLALESGGHLASMDTKLSTINTTLGSPFQAGGSIGNTSFAATQATAASLNATVVTTGGTTIAKDSSLSTINTTLGTPMQNTGGAVTANAGTNLNTSALALSATQTNGTQQTKITDGTNIGTVKAASTAAVAADTAIVVAVSPNNTPVLPSGAATAAGLTTINSTLGTPMQNSGGSVTANAGTNLNTSALALNTSVTGLQVTQGSTTSGQSGELIQAAATTSPPSYTTGQTSPLSLTLSGRLRTDLGSVAGTATATGGIAGLLAVAGDSASSAADSGSDPLKIGSVYNSTLPSATSGNRLDLQSNKFGEIAIRRRNKFSNLTAAATTTVKSGAGVLAGICLNNGTASTTITIYDNTAASGTKIGTVAVGAVSLYGSCMMFDAEFATGLTIVTTVASTDITVLYQ